MVRNEKEVEIIPVPFSRLYKNSEYRKKLFERIRKGEIEIAVTCDNELPVKITKLEFK
jgi:hypothetical protein